MDLFWNQVAHSGARIATNHITHLSLLFLAHTSKFATRTLVWLSGFAGAVSVVLIRALCCVSFSSQWTSQRAAKKVFLITANLHSSRAATQDISMHIYWPWNHVFCRSKNLVDRVKTLEELCHQDSLSSGRNDQNRAAIVNPNISKSLCRLHQPLEHCRTLPVPTQQICPNPCWERLTTCFWSDTKTSLAEFECIQLIRSTGSFSSQAQEMEAGQIGDYRTRNGPVRHQDKSIDADNGLTSSFWHNSSTK